MEKYKTFDVIRKKDIESFSGLEREISLAPLPGTSLLPIEISRFGITYPDKNYRIKRTPSPCFIIEYIDSGSGYIEINGVKHKLSEKDVYIVHPGDFCEYYADKRDPYKKYWINFRSSHFFDFLKAYKIEERVIKGFDASHYFEEIFALEKKSKKCDELYLPISKILFSMMLDIAVYKNENDAKDTFGLAARVKDYLQHSLSSNISMETLEREYYRSKSQITKVFKKTYNITPYAYLIDLRIQLAKNLLKTTSKPVSEIAEYLCFSSEYHFSGSFKKRVGVCPREYRKKQDVK